MSPAKYPYLCLALAVLVGDQITKWQVEARLVGEAPREVIPGLLNFVYVRNTGVAFGLFPSNGELWSTMVLTLLGLGALTIVAIYFWRTPATERLLLTSLGLILGGAVGNLADRVLQGGVTDFIDFYFGSYHWHTFNVADSAITIGIVLMLFDVFRSRPGERVTEPRDEPEDPCTDDRSERAAAPG